MRKSAKRILGIIIITLVVVSAVVMAGCISTSTTSTSNEEQGYLKVVSYPEGATIQIEGVNYRGKTPQDAIPLKPGNYRVYLTLAGYDDLDTDVTIKPGETAKLYMLLDSNVLYDDEVSISDQKDATTAKSPFPLLGILAGIGAVSIYLLRRK